MLAVGDRVTYSRKFLKSICASPTDSWWHMRGRVTEVRDHGNRRVVRVRWEDYDEDVSILVENLINVKDLHKEAN